MAYRKDMMSQLLDNGWLKSLPSQEQFLLFQYAPTEVKDYLPKWDVIHPHTLRLLGMKVIR